MGHDGGGKGSAQVQQHTRHEHPEQHSSQNQLNPHVYVVLRKLIHIHVEHLMDHCEDNGVDSGNSHLGATWRQRQQDAGGQDEKEECGRQQIEVAHF